MLGFALASVALPLALAAAVADVSVSGAAVPQVVAAVADSNAFAGVKAIKASKVLPSLNHTPTHSC